MTSSISLRLSNPCEVEEAVPLIYSSGPDAFEYVFKSKKFQAQDFLKFAFLRKGGEFSYDNHQSLYLDDEFVGIGSTFNTVQASKFTIHDAKNILQFYRLSSPRIIKQGLQIEKILKHPVLNEVCLAHLAIKPSHWGKGYGKKLVQLLIKSVQQNDIGKFVLDVSDENPRAKALYDRLGFKTKAHVKSNLLNKYSYVPDHYRMELIR